MSKLTIYSRYNAPLQLKDFINYNDDSDNQSEIYCYIYNDENPDFFINNLGFGIDRQSERFNLLKYAVSKSKQQNIDSNGIFLEFGFCSGQTLNFIAGLGYEHDVYGFDSGNGIDESNIQNSPFAYTKTIDDIKLEKRVVNDYAYKKTKEDEVEVKIKLKIRTKAQENPFIPFTPLSNVGLILGAINETLPIFLKKFKDGSISANKDKIVEFIFIAINHLNNLNIETTKSILSLLSPFISKNTVIVLDRSSVLGIEDNIQSDENISTTGNELFFLTQDNVELKLLNRFILPPPSTKSILNKQKITPEDFQPGKNVLHFNSMDRANQLFSNRSALTLRNYMKNQDKAEELDSDSAVLQWAIDKARTYWPGEKRKSAFLEFGFCTGRSINFIASLMQENERVFGFDSGNGLNEYWRYGFPEKTFKYTMSYLPDELTFKWRDDEDSVPFIPFVPNKNVHLVLGMIENTLSIFKNSILREENYYVPLIFIDTDVYKAAKTVLDELRDFIVPQKTIIVLDEGYNFQAESNPDTGEIGPRDWERHEFKAINDFATEHTLDRKYLAYNGNGQQIVLTFSE